MPIHRTFLESSSTHHIDSFTTETRSSYSSGSPSSRGQESGGQDFACPYHSRTDCPSADPSRLFREKDPSASDSARPQGVLQVPVRSRLSAAVASPLPTPSSNAQAASPGAPNVTRSPPAQATAARNKVELLAKKHSPYVTTPIDVDVLERELDGHSDRNFVNTLIICFAMSATQKPRVSRDLVSTNQQPDVVMSNLL